MKTIEEWKDIKGYEGKYMVSSHGRVKSLKDNLGRYRELILKFHIDKDGYRQVDLSKNSNTKRFFVHRLVALTFISNPNNYPIVNHKDEDKTNNNVNNLEWCTVKYNNCYGKRMRKIYKPIICVTTGEKFKGAIFASKKYNIPSTSITSCCKGKYKYRGRHPITKKPMIWKYLNEVEL